MLSRAHALVYWDRRDVIYYLVSLDGFRIGGARDVDGAGLADNNFVSLSLRPHKRCIDHISISLLFLDRLPHTLVYPLIAFARFFSDFVIKRLGWRPIRRVWMMADDVDEQAESLVLSLP